jgi:hypothetical protein
MHSILSCKSLVLIVIWFALNGKITKSYAQTESTDKVITDSKLTWNDFAGQVDKDSKYWARTEWRGTYKYRVTSSHQDTVSVELSALPVLKASSWVLPDKKVSELLVHEQGHFNFALLVVAEFKKTVKATPLLKSDCKQKVSFIFNSILNNVKQIEIQYDEETNHMKNKKEQTRWNTKIDEMLKIAQ